MVGRFDYDVPARPYSRDGLRECAVTIYSAGGAGVTLTSLVAAPDTYQGKTVILGGRRRSAAERPAALAPSEKSASG